MVYNILLVNSEKTMVNALRDVLARQENLNVMTAYGATEAQDFLSKHSIDLAVIDIKKEPSGASENSSDLSLLKTIKQNWEFCHVVIFTEISDFEPLYTATQYPKTKYILKSDGFTALINLISVNLQEIYRDRQTDEIVTQARRQLMEANEIIKNDMFLNIIQGGDTGEWAKKINLSIDRDKNFILVLGACKQINTGLDYEENSHQNHKIAKMVSLYLSSYCKYEYLIDKHGNLLYFIQPAYADEINPQFIAAVKVHLEMAQENISTAENVSISFIVDANVSWDSLKEQVGRCTMLFSVYHGMDDSHFITDADSRFLMGINRKEEDDILSGLPAKMIKNDMQKFLQAGDSQGCDNALLSFKDILGTGYSIHSYEAQLIYLNAATAILSHIHANKLVSQLAAETSLYRLTQTETFQNWGEGFDYLRSLCETIIKSQSRESSTYAKNLVDRVKGHIRKNIFNPDHITLPFIADMVHFNPSYLSRLFKKVTNVSISDYIMECKLTQAKHLLADSDTKIQDIAENLGYTSQSNFARVFKKATGMTPNDFRSQSNWSGRRENKNKH